MQPLAHTLNALPKKATIRWLKEGMLSSPPAMVGRQTSKLGDHCGPFQPRPFYDLQEMLKPF